MTRPGLSLLAVAGCVALFLIGRPLITSAQDGPAPGELFQRGNSLYQAGDFDGALEAYSAIIDRGLESGDLHYNLGNAYFKLGRIGPAVLAYERARRAMPGDENVLANLQLARSLTADQIEALPRFWGVRVWNWWVELLPRGMLFGVVAFGYMGLMALFIWRFLSPATGRTWGRRLAPACMAVTLVFALNLAIRELGVGRSDHAVVMATETPVQSAPADDPGLQLFSIHEGTTVRIDRRSDGWLEVVLEDGKVGWLESSVVEII
jgi:hypothetical protein